MLKLIGTALGAGVTSAVLIAVTTTHTLTGLALAQLAPLPIMIAGLGFPPAVGAAAALVAAGAVALASGPVSGLLFLVVYTVPSFLLARLAVREGRAGAGAGGGTGAGPGAGGPAWTRASTLVLALAASAAVPVLLLGGAVLAWSGGYEPARARAARFATEVLAGSPFSGDVPVDLLVRRAPLALAVGLFLLLAGNLWLAGRSVQLSGWLTRPWPALPEGLRLPRAAAGALAVLAVAVLLPDPYGIAASVMAGTLALAFAFEGLALVHATTRHRPTRVPILVGTYLALLVLKPLSLLALVVAGCIDCLVPALRRGGAIKITKPKRRQ